MIEDRYSDWDAAYVIGALSADERREYERHLTACDACREQVAELAGMPGLLAAVPVAQAVAARDAAKEVTEQRMPPASLPRLLAAAKSQRRRSRALFAGAVTVAAGLAASLALVLPGWTGEANPAPAPAQAVTAVLEQVVPSPLSADVALDDHAWGTRIDAHCAYAESQYAAGAQAYAMYVTDRQGQQSEVATWLARPGTTVEAVGTTWLRARDIAAVDIRSVETGQVLLESRLTGG
jgi:anti-sigma factor RsiW